MKNDFPVAGQVFDYHYLWRWQDTLGETEGRKKRPSCLALVTVNTSGQHVLFILPITSKEPNRGRIGLAIPETEAHRGQLDTHIPLWVILDEMNVDILEASYVLEDRTPRGQFSSAFTDLVLRQVQSMRKNGKLTISNRS